jgi:uncharacterized membrane protein
MTANIPNNDPEPVSEQSAAEVETRASSDPHQSWLKSRIRKWRESDLITDDQAQAILNYETDSTPRFQLGIRFNRLIVVLSTLGAVLIAAGIISFVAANWQGIPAMAKLLILVTGQVTAYWVAYQLLYVRGYPRVGGAVMFAGAAWFGANVFLVAQSYHLANDNPDLLIWWFLGILPLAYITRSNPITVMALGIFMIGISWKAATWAGDSENFFVVVGILFLGAAAIYAVGMSHLGRKKLKFHAGPYLAGGVLLAIGLTYILTFDEVFRELTYRHINDFRTVTGSQYVLASIVSVIAIVALVLADRFSAQTGKSLASRFAEPGVVVLVVALGWLVILLPFDSPTLYVVAFNLFLIVLIFGTITLGIVNRREALVNIGIVFFVINLSTRYIELTVDMLDTSLAFIVGGLLLLGVGYVMERGRRRLLQHYGMPIGRNPKSGPEVSYDS